MDNLHFPNWIEMKKKKEIIKDETKNAIFQHYKKKAFPKRQIYGILWKRELFHHTHSLSILLTQNRV